MRFIDDIINRIKAHFRSGVFECEEISRCQKITYRFSKKTKRLHCDWGPAKITVNNRDRWNPMRLEEYYVHGKRVGSSGNGGIKEAWNSGPMAAEFGKYGDEFTNAMEEKNPSPSFTIVEARGIDGIVMKYKYEFGGYEEIHEQR